jgi:hypothetical protein
VGLFLSGVGTGTVSFISTGTASGFDQGILGVPFYVISALGTRSAGPVTQGGEYDGTGAGITITNGLSTNPGQSLIAFNNGNPGSPPNPFPAFTGRVHVPATTDVATATSGIVTAWHNQ